MAKPLELEVLCFIVDAGQAGRLMKFCREHGAPGATAFFGMGTAGHRKKWHEVFDLLEVRKEIVITVLERETSEHVVDAACVKFKFMKPNRGIAFRMPVSKMYGSAHYADYDECEGEVGTMTKAIFTIVDKGMAEAVVDAAVEAGAKGGTIIHARGAGIHETKKVFNVEITPEKEIVLILSESDTCESITDAIRSKLDIDKPGKGLIFVQEVIKTYGMQ